MPARTARDKLKALLWIVGLATAGLLFWLQMPMQPWDAARLYLWQRVAQGQVVDASEEYVVVDGEEGQSWAGWVTTYIYVIETPNGQGKGSYDESGTIPTDLKLPFPLEVDYLPSNPNLNRPHGPESFCGIAIHHEYRERAYRRWVAAGEPMPKTKREHRRFRWMMNRPRS
jgi:hypothetical protein